MEPILKMEILKHLRAAILCLSALPANKKLPNMWLQLLMFQLTPTACNLGGGAQQQTLVTDWNTGGSCWTSGNISQLSTCSQHKPKPQPQHQSLWTKLSLLQPKPAQDESTGTGFSGRCRVSHLTQTPKWTGHDPGHLTAWAEWNKDDVQMCLPVSAILWFCYYFFTVCFPEELSSLHSTLCHQVMPSASSTWGCRNLRSHHISRWTHCPALDSLQHLLLHLTPGTQTGHSTPKCWPEEKNPWACWPHISWYIPAGAGLHWKGTFRHC